MSAPKVGDRVRVTFDAVYHGRVDGRHVVKLLVGANGPGSVLATLPADAEVEVLRPPVKVGDVIEDQAQGESLPIRSVVRDGSANIAERFAEGWRWVGMRGSTFGVDLPATVLYLPDGAA